MHGGIRVTIWEAIAVFAAGIGAGTINTVVGSGTLITFPVLLAFGLPPVTANVSNTLGLVPGSISGAIGYRRELTGQRARILRFGLVALVGGLTGAILLLALPSEAFDTIVPVLIALALVLVIAQPKLAAALRARRERTGTTAQRDGGIALLVGLLFASAYGGYFGAAQGVLYLSLMGLLLHRRPAAHQRPQERPRRDRQRRRRGLLPLRRDFDWAAVGLIALGSTLGGQLGAKVGRRLPPTALRAVIVVVGLLAIIQLLLK